MMNEEDKQYLYGHDTPESLFREQDESFAKGCFIIVTSVFLLIIIGIIVVSWMWVFN